jgi:hypothetical protein
MQIELTKDEARVLVQLLDVATKAGGLAVAQVAVTMAAKIEAAARVERDDGDASQAGK